MPRRSARKPREVARLLNPAEHVEGRDAANFKADLRPMVQRLGSGIPSKDKVFLAKLGATALVPDPADPARMLVKMTDREWSRFVQLRQHFLDTRERLTRAFGLRRLVGLPSARQPHPDDPSRDEHGFPLAEDAVAEPSPIPLLPPHC